MNDCLGILNPLYGRRFTSLLSHLLLYLSLILAITACTAPERRVIKNPEMNQWHATKWRYVNLFQPEYGYLEETEFDQIEFRKPLEMGTRKYAILSDPRGDIDRSKGYDASEYTVSPELDLIHNPTHDVQITWIRHATFLIQLGGKYQILVDPVLAQVDGMTGALMKFGYLPDADYRLVPTPLALYPGGCGSSSRRFRVQDFNSLGMGDLGYEF